MSDALTLENPTIFIGSFEFREPVTSITDVLASLVACFALWFLVQHKSKASSTFVFYKNYFLWFTVGFLVAGMVGHGLQAYLTPGWKIWGWVFTLIGQMFLAMASLKHVELIEPKKYLGVLKTLVQAITALFVLLILIPQTSSFIIPQIANTLLVAGIILPFQFYNYQKTKNRGSLLIVIALLIASLTAIVFNMQIGINQWFNHQDISHIIMAASMFLIFLGAKKLALK